MADVTCARCDKTWDAQHLQHEMGRLKCVDCGASIVKFSDGSWQDKRSPWQGSPGNCTHPLGGEMHWDDTHSAGVPAEIAGTTDPQAWFKIVIAGRGCPECGVRSEPSDPSVDGDDGSGRQ